MCSIFGNKVANMGIVEILTIHKPTLQINAIFDIFFSLYHNTHVVYLL